MNIIPPNHYCREQFSTEADSEVGGCRRNYARRGRNFWSGAGSWHPRSSPASFSSMLGYRKQPGHNQASLHLPPTETRLHLLLRFMGRLRPRDVRCVVPSWWQSWPENQYEMTHRLSGTCEGKGVPWSDCWLKGRPEVEVNQITPKYIPSFPHERIQGISRLYGHTVKNGELNFAAAC